MLVFPYGVGLKVSAATADTAGRTGFHASLEAESRTEQAFRPAAALGAFFYRPGRHLLEYLEAVAAFFTLVIVRWHGPVLFYALLSSVSIFPAAFLPDRSIPPNIGPMRGPPYAAHTAMPDRYNPG